MKKFLLLCLALFVLLAEAHKSVRHRRPESEEEAEARHQFHRRVPGHGEDRGHENKLEHGLKPHPNRAVYRSPRYHLQYGPKYPGDEITAHNPPHRFDVAGKPIDFHSVPHGFDPTMKQEIPLDHTDGNMKKE